MTEPVLDLTDGGPPRSPRTPRPRAAVVPLSAVIDQPGAATDAPERRGRRVRHRRSGPTTWRRPAIGRASDSAAAPGRTQAFATEQPSRRREQLRDGRNLL